MTATSLSSNTVTEATSPVGSFCMAHSRVSWELRRTPTAGQIGRISASTITERVEKEEEEDTAASHQNQHDRRKWLIVHLNGGKEPGSRSRTGHTLMFCCCHLLSSLATLSTFSNNCNRGTHDPRSSSGQTLHFRCWFYYSVMCVCTALAMFVCKLSFVEILFGLSMFPWQPVIGISENSMSGLRGQG